MSLISKTLTGHKEYNGIGCCSESHANPARPEDGSPRFTATCLLEYGGEDNYGTYTIETSPVCRLHCPFCSVPVVEAEAPEDLPEELELPMKENPPPGYQEATSYKHLARGCRFWVKC